MVALEEGHMRNGATVPETRVGAKVGRTDTHTDGQPVEGFIVTCELMVATNTFLKYTGLRTLSRFFKNSRSTSLYICYSSIAKRHKITFKVVKNLT